MKMRNLGLVITLVGCLGGVALGRGETRIMTAGPDSILHSSVGASTLLPTALPNPFAAFPQSVPPSTGPLPVNFLTAGIYQNNAHPNNGGLSYLAFGDFNGDGKKDIVAVDGSACISVFPGDGKGDYSAAPIDSCVFPVRNIYFVVAGDFNNDGILDVAVVSQNCCNPNNIYVMWAQGNGDGTFTYLSGSTVGYSWAGGAGQLGYGEGARSLRAADLNGDGNLDLVMTTSGSGPNNNSIYIFLGDGKFGFTQNPFSPFGGCSATNGAVIADFNHDGKPDLAVTNTACGVHEVQIMLGNGDGTFQPVASNGRFATDTGGPSDIAAGDFNGDGNLDVVVIVGAGGNPITSFLGNGDGTFGSPIDSTSVYNPNYLAVGDFNGDGKDDVIVSSFYGSGSFDGVQLSNGDGTFAPPVNYSVLSSPTRVFVIDLNGDGSPDWVSLSSGSEYFCVGLGSGTGGFLAAEDSIATPGPFGSGTTTGIVAADFNHDGHLDYATVGSDIYFPGINISVGDGSGDFAAPVHYSAGSNPAEITAGDFNHDGYPDIAVLDQSDDTVSVLLNKGDGTFANAASYAVGAGGGYIQTADLNSDGNPDLIVTNSSDGTVSVLLGNPDGTFQSQHVYTTQTNGSYLAVADFNGDGIPDIAVTNYSGPSISILLGDGVGGFQSPTSFASGLQISCGLAAADFNNDGKADLAVCGQLINNGTNGDGGVAIFLGNGNGSFQTPVSYPTVPVGLNGNPVTFGIPRVGDLNNDGNLDIVIPNNNAYTDGVNLGPAILLGKGDGTFTLNPAHAAITGTKQQDIALGDFNNDGFLDMAVLNFDGYGDSFASTVTMLLSTSGTEVVFTSSLNPSTEGQSVTFTATVETSVIGLPKPTGTVTFELGSIDAPVALVNGVATYITSALPLGNTTGFAAYSGDTNFIPSTSLGLLQVVKPAPLTITTTGLPDAVQNVSYSGNVAADGGIGPYTFTTTSGTLPAGLTLNSTGVISGTPTGLPGTSSFTVQAKDSESPAMTATASLSITVASNLIFTTTSVPGGIVGNSYSASLSATGGVPSYTYSISAGSLPGGLSISAAGVIPGTPTTTGTSNFTVQVKDSASPAQITTGNLSITITGALMITTTSLPNGVEGSAYGASVSATGGIPSYSFSITTGTLPGGLSMSTSGAISGTPALPGTSSFTVQAKDSSSPAQIVTANLSITIATNLGITTTSLPNGVVGNLYSATVIGTGGNLPYTFLITSGSLPTGLSMSTAGLISGTPSATGTSSFTVQLKDSSNPIQATTANLSITISGALTITTASLPNGVEGISYSASVTATGGIPSYSFSITSGSLPTGLSMSTSGAISGTPTLPGTSNFTVQAKDSSSPAQTATSNLSIVVGSNLAITTTSLPNGVATFAAYSATLTAGGGNAPYTFSIISGNLPAGLSMSSGGVISGTASATGTSSFTVQVKDSSSPAQTASASLSIKINALLMVSTLSPLPDGVLGSPYSVSIASTGGTQPYNYSIISGGLPGGLSMSTGGVITGTPTTTGLALFELQVTDSSTPAQTTTDNVSITVYTPLVVTTTSLPGGYQNFSYNAGIAASGGIQPYTFSVIGGALPSGISMNSNGIFSGAPSGVNGTSNFTVQVTDANHPVQTATANLSITIGSNLSITTVSLPIALENSQYAAKIMASGGSKPYTFSLPLGGGLPQGLQLSSNGSISGRVFPPLETFNFTVQVADSSNPILTATANLSITVTSTFSITTSSLPGAFVGYPYKATVAAAGGKTPFNFSIANGSLPAGLSMSSSGDISGAPSPGFEGTFTFTVEATDSSSLIQTASANLSIVVNAGLSISTTTLANGSPGMPYGASISASGGNAPYTFSLAGGSLPVGLSMSTSGIISGTPSGPDRISNFIVRVKDSSSPPQSTTQSLSIEISNVLTITTTSVPNGTVGVSYHAQIMAVGGIRPYNFFDFSTPLPAGLAISLNGTISGTPTATGTTLILINVQDSSSPAQTAYSVYQITIAPGKP